MASPGADGALLPAAWEKYLKDGDKDKDFIMEGVRFGFRITNKDTGQASAWFNNHKSALHPDRIKEVERQIRYEIENGRYVVVKDRPRIVSGLAAIPKADGAIRLIHDASRPAGYALNDYAVNDPFKYQSVQQAASYIERGDYLAKVDLASAYRSVKIHPDDYQVAGLAWSFNADTVTYLEDRRLMFGARLSASIFNTLSLAVCRFMAQEGYPHVTAYLDDFLIKGSTQQECQRGLNRLMSLLRELGFAIAYKKVVPPTTCLTFLGIEFDTVAFVFRLPGDKLRALIRELKGVMNKRSVSKGDLRSLAGRLSWASRVIYGGRTFTRRIIDRINLLQKPSHRTRVTGCMRSDLQWWFDFINTFNGVVPILEERAYTPVTVDASLSGGGGVYGADWFHVAWRDCPDIERLHINYLEVLVLEPAARVFGAAWSNRLVTVYSDNQAAVGIINKGTAKNEHVMRSLRSVFWLSAVYNFRLKAVYYPGVRNVLADRASRLQEPGGYAELQRALAASCWPHPVAGQCESPGKPGY